MDQPPATELKFDEATFVFEIKYHPGHVCSAEEAAILEEVMRRDLVKQYKPQVREKVQNGKLPQAAKTNLFLSMNRAREAWPVEGRVKWLDPFLQTAWEWAKIQTKIPAGTPNIKKLRSEAAMKILFGPQHETLMKLAEMSLTPKRAAE